MRLVISSSSRDTHALFRELLLLCLWSRLRHIPKWAGNKRSCAHRNTNTFLRFVTTAFVTSGQHFVRLKIALDMWQGRELAYGEIDLLPRIFGFCHSPVDIHAHSCTCVLTHACATCTQIKERMTKAEYSFSLPTSNEVWSSQFQLLHGKRGTS